jgi:hypothetical protein
MAIPDYPFDPDPAVMGAREHFARAGWFCELAGRTKDPVEQHRLLFAALYSARAIVEIILDAAEGQMMRAFHESDQKASRKACEAVLSPKFQHYHLVEKIRIHDFHRSGCLPSRKDRVTMFFGGPMKLTASKGGVAFAIPPSGPQVTTTGNSSYKDQRSLCGVDGTFFDEGTKSYLPLSQILNEYMRGVPDALAWFEKEIN